MTDLLSDAPPMPYLRYHQETIKMSGYTIHCTYVPLLPVRHVDWSAVTDDYEPPQPVGRGATMEAAIQDLLEQLED
jgi:hypothetical protein